MDQGHAATSTTASTYGSPRIEPLRSRPDVQISESLDINSARDWLQTKVDSGEEVNLNSTEAAKLLGLLNGVHPGLSLLNSTVFAYRSG